MRVVVVPCLRDNYAYLVAADGRRECVVVDASEADPVIAALEREGLTLRAVLCTHHHWDHVGGNQELAERFSIPVYGHESDRGRIPAQTDGLEDGSKFDVAGLSFSCLHVPGHTTGALAYVVGGAVFTGDTLFAGGCGRLFEGTPAMMYRSLNVSLGALPDATKVYCGHEYTQKNLEFAAHLEPGATAIREKAERVSAMRARGEPTVPSTIGEERLTNPFMRCDSEELRRAVADALGGESSAEAVLGAVRAAKDAF